MWGWALCILGLGRSVYMRVWEYVRGCLFDMYICAITAIYLSIQCVLAGKAYFSNLIF